MANTYWKMIMIPVWKKEDECEAEIKGPLLISFWLMFLFQACYHAHITHSVPAILLEFARLIWGITQYLGCRAWYQFDYKEMNVNLKLNGLLLLFLLLIFLFQMLYHAHLPCNVPRIAGPFITSDFYMKDDPKCWKLSMIPCWIVWIWRSMDLMCSLHWLIFLFLACCHAHISHSASVIFLEL
jgi:hypothetical protein